MSKSGFNIVPDKITPGGYSDRILVLIVARRKEGTSDVK